MPELQLETHKTGAVVTIKLPYITNEVEALREARREIEREIARRERAPRSY